MAASWTREGHLKIGNVTFAGDAPFMKDERGKCLVRGPSHEDAFASDTCIWCRKKAGPIESRGKHSLDG